MRCLEVNPDIVRWAIERSAKKIQLRFPKLTEWLEGKSQPTLSQLEDFAKATSTPFGYFFLKTPPEEKLPIPIFRTLAADIVERPSSDLLEIINMMHQRQSWMREYLIEQGFDALPFVRSAQLSEEPKHIAQQIRDALGLSRTWATTQPNWKAALRELRKRAEEAGIIVVSSGIVGNNTRRKLNPAEFRGFVLVDEYAPLVFINSSDGLAAQMFTLAHEVAHIWLGSSAVFDLRDLQPAKDETEKVCDHVAAEFLVPTDELAKQWPNAIDKTEPFQWLAHIFKVSEIVAARRALDLNLITREEFFDFYNRYKRLEHPTFKGGGRSNFYAVQLLRLGKRFAKMVTRAALEGSLLYHEAYRLTDLHGRVFDGLIEYLSREL